MAIGYEFLKWEKRGMFRPFWELTNGKEVLATFTIKDRFFGHLVEMTYGDKIVEMKQDSKSSDFSLTEKKSGTSMGHTDYPPLLKMFYYPSFGKKYIVMGENGLTYFTDEGGRKISVSQYCRGAIEVYGTFQMLDCQTGNPDPELIDGMSLWVGIFSSMRF